MGRRGEAEDDGEAVAVAVAVAVPVLEVGGGCTLELVDRFRGDAFYPVSGIDRGPVCAWF